jgi:hypothetical protein
LSAAASAYSLVSRTPTIGSNAQFWTTDAMDYASTSVTFCSFSLAAACVIVGELSGRLAPGGSSWFSLPGALTADQITMVAPEPASLLLIGIGLSALCFKRRRKA